MIKYPLIEMRGGNTQMLLLPARISKPQIYELHVLVFDELHYVFNRHVNISNKKLKKSV